MRDMRKEISGAVATSVYAATERAIAAFVGLSRLCNMEDDFIRQVLEDMICKVIERPEQEDEEEETDNE